MAIDTDAFGSPPGPVRDKDGFLVPAVWQGNPDKYSKLPEKMRRARHEELLAEMNAPAPEPKVKRPAAKRFTTDAAVAWGRKQREKGAPKNWVLIEREGYDHLTKRHHDCELGSDAIFDDQVRGRVLVQGAGRGEKEAHRKRFLDRGGPDTCRRRGARFVYVEFVRGNPEPVLLEWWVK